MDEWSGLRSALIVVVWLTVAVGVVMGAVWFFAGGARALGPEDDDMGGASPRSRRGETRTTSFSTSQVMIHGLLGILTAAAITYGGTLDDARTGGYVALLAAVAVTVVPGALMLRKWLSGARPAAATQVARSSRRAEDRLPMPVVVAHGAAALATLALLVVLIVVD